MISSLVLTILALALQNAVGCTCLRLTVNETLHQSGTNTMVFRGTVIRDLTVISTPATPTGINVTTSAVKSVVSVETTKEPNQYVVQVSRVYKGCAIKTNDRILVSSNNGGAWCGRSLTVGNHYVFSSSINQPLDPTLRAQLGNRSKVRQNVWISSCGFNAVWSTVSATDKTTIEQYSKPLCMAASQP